MIWLSLSNYHSLTFSSFSIRSAIMSLLLFSVISNLFFVVVGLSSFLLFQSSYIPINVSGFSFFKIQSMCRVLLPLHIFCLHDHTSIPTRPSFILNTWLFSFSHVSTLSVRLLCPCLSVFYLSFLLSTFCLQHETIAFILVIFLIWIKQKVRERFQG